MFRIMLRCVSDQGKNVLTIFVGCAGRYIPSMSHILAVRKVARSPAKASLTKLYRDRHNRGEFELRQNLLLERGNPATAVLAAT
jgi:hypothetical protein